MNDSQQKILKAELAELAENLEIHHPRRDGDWLRPEDLRKLLRLMYMLVVNTDYVQERLL